MCRISNVRVVTIAVRRPYVTRVIPPGPGPNDMRHAVGLDPGRTIRRGALIVLVPAILDPLIDPAAHIIEPKWIWLKTANLDRRFCGRDLAAILAICPAGLHLVTPPIFRFMDSAPGIIPTRLDRKPGP